MLLMSETYLWCTVRLRTRSHPTLDVHCTLEDVINQHRMQFYFYADDSQVYVSFKPWADGEPACSKSRIELCIQDINKWMTANKLMLNSDKTELLVLNARHRPPPPLNNISIGPDLISTSNSANNIGVWFDNVLSMDKQISNICKSAFYHLRNISQKLGNSSLSNTVKLIHAFITSMLQLL